MSRRNNIRLSHSKYIYIRNKKRRDKKKEKAIRDRSRVIAPRLINSARPKQRLSRGRAEHGAIVRLAFVKIAVTPRLAC